MQSQHKKSDNKPIQRSRLTLKEKYNLIKDHENQMGVEKLKEKYKCGKTAVYEIIRSKKKINDEYFSAQNVGVKNKQRQSKFDEINVKVFDWLKQVLAKNLLISGLLLREKAKEIAVASGLGDFKASNGWLESFKQRHKLTFSAVCGESNDTCTEQTPIDDFLDKLPEIIAAYKPEDIASCDETALFFKAIPRKTLHRKGDKCFSGKYSKERLTALKNYFFGEKVTIKRLIHELVVEKSHHNEIEILMKLFSCSHF